MMLERGNWHRHRRCESGLNSQADAKDTCPSRSMIIPGAPVLRTLAQKVGASRFTALWSHAMYILLVNAIQEEISK